MVPKSSHTAWRCCTLVNSAASLTISCYNFIKSASWVTTDIMVWNDCIANNTDRIFSKDIPVLTVCIMECSMLPLTQHDHFCLQGIRRSNQKYNMKLFCLSFLSLKISFFFLLQADRRLWEAHSISPRGSHQESRAFFFLQKQRRSCTKWLVYLFKLRRGTHPPVIH